jgi:subtilisin family serine protease
MVPNFIERLDVRVLDPSTAVRGPGGAVPSATAYRNSRIIVNAPNRAVADQILDAIDTIAGAREFNLVRQDTLPFNPDSPSINRTAPSRTGDHARTIRDRAVRLGRAQDTGHPLVFAVRLMRADQNPAPPADVWEIVRRLKVQSHEDTKVAAAIRDGVGLDHVMGTGTQISGAPFGIGPRLAGAPFGIGPAAAEGAPFGIGPAGVAVASYALAGSGGRSPVSIVAPTPEPVADDAATRVVVLDTGIGDHPWYNRDDDGRPVVARVELADGSVIGWDVSQPSARATDPERSAAKANLMLGFFPTHIGHGTFITGMLRQGAPSTEICALRIMDADGVVAETDLTDALSELVAHQEQNPWWCDALVLSIGYYSETPEDEQYTSGLRDLLLQLGRQGTAVFAAAGNDATDRRFYPAALADDPAFTTPRKMVPLTSVAALNPDGKTVALFSNDGQWVRAYARGANVISTVPTGIQGAVQATISIPNPETGRTRATIDPDDYSSGFATWSGTSFAAPALAGTYLRALGKAGRPTDIVKRRAILRKVVADAQLGKRNP